MATNGFAHGTTTTAATNGINDVVKTSSKPAVSSESATIPTSSSSDATFDVVIIGAGISGINAAYRVQTGNPGYSYTVLEARRDIGGTWDLFRYPGIRSDSDLFTFGFPWNPWSNPNAIGEGGHIVKYMKQSQSARH